MDFKKNEHIEQLKAWKLQIIVESACETFLGNFHIGINKIQIMWNDNTINEKLL